ncbi:MAG: ribonuclease D [Rhodospirillales bacterium]|nr:ribonuclease D [Rhodospirillales bacterium]
MTLITDTAALEAFCQRQASSEFLTVDTEFMREKTYWPILCLVQVGGPEEAAAIDPLAPGIDLTPLFDLLSIPTIVKVFHAARQDLEIFYHLNGKLPEPVFDTQVAAMVCGFGDQVGYETLVSKLTKARIDKSSRFTDWALRPLSERQITYALSDVTHLRPVYEKILRKLGSNGRAEWLKEEMSVLTSPDTYAMHPELAFRRIKSKSSNTRFLAVLREVAAWREMEAQKRDLPRNRVLRDEALMEIAHHTPQTVDDLARTRSLGRRLAEGASGAELLKAIKKGVDLPKSECPEPKARPDLPQGLGAITELLKVLLKVRCTEQGVAQKLVASSADIDFIAGFGEKADVPAMHGWRFQVYGQDALRLMNGELALVLNGKKLELVELEPEEDSGA